MVGSTGVSHNGIFRGKNLGSISSLNEYIAFRSAHGIDDNSYKDLYLGDYFQINDGTYNAIWMVAHFDYYWNKGDTANGRGVILIPLTILSGEVKMHATDNTTVGAYKSSLAFTTHCPAVGTALQRVLGSYLQSTKCLISNAMGDSIPSMAGIGIYGASNSWSWESVLAVLPNEIQIYGSTALSSSYYDIGDANEKLAVFNFINQIHHARYGFWFKTVASAVAYSRASSYGSVGYSGASAPLPIRPLIYIS